MGCLLVWLGSLGVETSAIYRFYFLFSYFPCLAGRARHHTMLPHAQLALCLVGVWFNLFDVVVWRT